LTRAKSQSEQARVIWRVVFDSNVFVAASLSKNPKSPNKELLLRWKQGEFSLLVSESIYKELIEN
jgi:predicted nucleic acid-binding protein